MRAGSMSTDTAGGGGKADDKVEPRASRAKALPVQTALTDRGASGDGGDIPAPGDGPAAPVKTGPTVPVKTNPADERPAAGGLRASGRRPSRRPTVRMQFTRRGSVRRRRARRKSRSADRDDGRSASERYRASYSVIHAANHWRWRSQQWRQLSHDRNPEPELPASMHPKVPAHSIWLWNSRWGELHWRSAPHNPVEEFFQTAVSEQTLKRQVGLFGRRYTKYPNQSTWAGVETGRGIFARALSKAEDTAGKPPPDSQTVGIEDVKTVAEAAVGQFFPTAYGRRRFSLIPNMNQFLLSIIEYFHHYFKDRKLIELAKQNNCLVFDRGGRAERKLRMHECQREMAHCYAKFILGRDMPFHHMNQGAFGSISAASADRQFWEALYAFTIQVVWITFGRPAVAVIARELGRVFRTLYFDPARRDVSTRTYKTADQRRNAALGLSPPRAKQRRPSAPPAARPTNAVEMASQNYLAMCVAMARVYGEYDCPPMPPKPIYGLLNNRSAPLGLLLSEDQERPPTAQHAVDRASIGILGHPRRQFDSNLDPIDEPRQRKYRKLKFLGAISERAQVTRIPTVTPYLLQPSPPSASDLERFT